MSEAYELYLSTPKSHWARVVDLDPDTVDSWSGQPATREAVDEHCEVDGSHDRCPFGVDAVIVVGQQDPELISIASQWDCFGPDVAVSWLQSSCGHHVDRATQERLEVVL